MLRTSVKMFAKYQDEKTRQWNNLINRYISLHKYIKDLGKTSISQGRSGRVSNEVQLQLVDAFKQTDKTLSQLKELFRPCFTDVDVTEIFPQDKFTKEVESLKSEIAKLRIENEYLQQQLSEQYKMHNGDAEEEIKALQQKLDLTHQIYERKRHFLLREKKELQQKVEQLTKEIHRLKLIGSQKSLSAEEKTDGTSQEALEKNKLADLQMMFLKKQQQFEETLKAQNDLIYDLKQQLVESARNREIFKRLNRDLENELQKTRQDAHLENYLKKSTPELRNVDDLENDYFHRTTLKVDDYNPQVKSLNRRQSFERKNLHPEEDSQSYQPRYQSLQDIPVSYEQDHDKVFLKSQSYDLTERDHILDESLLKFQANYPEFHRRDVEQVHAKLGGEMERQYSTERLQRMLEEENLK